MASPGWPDGEAKAKGLYVTVERIILLRIPLADVHRAVADVHVLTTSLGWKAIRFDLPATARLHKAELEFHTGVDPVLIGARLGRCGVEVLAWREAK